MGVRVVERGGSRSKRGHIMDDQQGKGVIYSMIIKGGHIFDEHQGGSITSTDMHWGEEEDWLAMIQICRDKQGVGGGGGGGGVLRGVIN